VRKILQIRYGKKRGELRPPTPSPLCRAAGLRLVYEKLPTHVLDELRRLNPIKNPKTWRREATHFQHLSADIGQPDLRDHLLQLIAIMRASPNWGTFKRLFALAFPGPGGRQPEIDNILQNDAIDI
jgi:hypothetical protein